MKKLLATVLIAFALSFTFQSTSYAQEHTTKLGVGVVYGEEVESAGINVNATFRVAPQIAIAPNINIYFPDEEDTGLDSFWSVNLDGHYIFVADPDFHVYGLGGLNLAIIDPEVGDSESELGVNLGIGGEVHLQSFSIFSELKYVVGDLDQVVLGLGARFPLN